MYVFISFVLLLIAATVRLAVGLDVSWLPSDADGDGPLPLSSSYRENLRKLCTVFADKAKPLPVYV